MFENLKELRKPRNVELFYAQGWYRDAPSPSVDALFALFARFSPTRSTPPQLAGRTTPFEDEEHHGKFLLKPLS
jgi:hypothetical protein